MSFRLNISPAVKQEMALAFAWYAEKNAEAAENFRDEVLAAFDLIAQHPDRFPLRGMWCVVS
jgi:plasmid stabilization system protein ParE